MPLTYDLTTDLRYQQGKEQGIEQGIERGVSMAKLEVVVRLIQHSRHDDAFIAGIARVEIQKVAEIRRVIAQHPGDFWKYLKKD